jgi:hypothetical protein
MLWKIRLAFRAEIILVPFQTMDNSAFSGFYVAAELDDIIFTILSSLIILLFHFGHICLATG